MKQSVWENSNTTLPGIWIDQGSSPVLGCYKITALGTGVNTSKLLASSKTGLGYLRPSLPLNAKNCCGLFEVIKIQRLFRRFLARKQALQMMLKHQLSEDEMSLEEMDDNLKP